MKITRSRIKITTFAANEIFQQWTNLNLFPHKKYSQYNFLSCHILRLRTTYSQAKQMLYSFITV